MKRTLIALVCTLCLGVGAAQAATFDFETTPLGTYSSLTMTDSGLSVTITRTSGSNFDVATTFAGQPASWGARDMHNFNHGFPAGDEYNANFSAGVSAVTIDFGDFGPSDDDTPVILRAYSGANGTGVLLGTDTETWLGSDSFPNFKTLSVASASAIGSIRFFGSGPFWNSLFWDNITATPAQVPEPATVALLGMAAAGLAGWRKRRASVR